MTKNSSEKSNAPHMPRGPPPPSGLTLIGAFCTSKYGTTCSANTDINDLINTVIDKHVPMRTASRSKQKQLRKPWMTNTILKSINKTKYVQANFLSNDPVKITEYKIFSNELDQVKVKVVNALQACKYFFAISLSYMYVRPGTRFDLTCSYPG